MNVVPPVYLAHVEAASAGDAARLTAIWAPHGVIEFPYAASVGTPGRLEGIDAITTYFGGLDLFGPFHVDRLEAWPTNGSTWWVEMRASSTVLSTGAAYVQDYVVRFTLDDAGRLTWMREFWDPTRFGTPHRQARH